MDSDGAQARSVGPESGPQGEEGEGRPGHGRGSFAPDFGAQARTLAPVGNKPELEASRRAI